MFKCFFVLVTHVARYTQDKFMVAKKTIRDAVNRVSILKGVCLGVILFGVSYLF